MHKAIIKLVILEQIYVFHCEINFQTLSKIVIKRANDKLIIDKYLILKFLVK